MAMRIVARIALPAALLAVGVAALAALSGGVPGAGAADTGASRAGSAAARPGRARRFPVAVRPARPRVGHAGALPGRVRHLLDHGGDGVAGVERAPPRGPAHGLLREQPGQPHVLAPRLRGHGAQRARRGLLRPLGGPRARGLGPVSPPRRLARLPARGAPRAGGAVPPGARARRGGQRRRQVGGEHLRRRGRGHRLRRGGRVQVLEREDELVLQRRAQRTRPPRPLRGLGRRLPRGRLRDPAGGRRRVPRQEQLGDGLRPAVATSGSPTTT